MLHDIGKIYELSYERGFSYTAEGQLLGHIAIAIRMLADKFRAFPEFPVELRNLLEHMVLSHHGLLEYGSPKVPIFPEALLLHYLDDLDSKMECMRALVEKEPQATGLFTGYSQSMERVALRKSRYLEPQPQVCRPAQGVPADEFDDITILLLRRLPAAPFLRRQNLKPRPLRFHLRIEASTGAQRRKEINMARDRELPPPLEMMCLNALWEIGEGNVEDVRRVVSATVRWHTRPF